MTTAPPRVDTAAHVARAIQRLAAMGKTSDRFEAVFEVDHNFHAGTWLVMTVYDRNVHVGRHVTGPKKDLQQIAYHGPVVKLDGYDDTHTLGICPECSERWRGEQS